MDDLNAIVKWVDGEYYVKGTRVKVQDVADIAGASNPDGDQTFETVENPVENVLGAFDVTEKEVKQALEAYERLEDEIEETRRENQKLLEEVADA